MAEYLNKLLNETHPDRRVIEDVLEEYLFNSDNDNDSDNETSVLLSNLPHFRTPPPTTSRHPVSWYLQIISHSLCSLYCVDIQPKFCY